MLINHHQKKWLDTVSRFVCCAMNSQRFFKLAMCYQYMQSAPLIATSARWTKVKVGGENAKWLPINNGHNFGPGTWSYIFQQMKNSRNMTQNFTQCTGTILVLWRVNLTANAAVMSADDICVRCTYRHSDWCCVFNVNFLKNKNM